jgi:hypothetical protein
MSESENTWDVNIGKAFIRFRRSTIQDYQKLAAELSPRLKAAEGGDQESRFSIELAADVRPDDARPGVGADVILYIMAARCLVGCSEGFYADAQVVALIGPNANKRPDREVLKDLLASPNIAAKVAGAIDLPLDAFRAIAAGKPKTES